MFGGAFAVKDGSARLRERTQAVFALLPLHARSGFPNLFKIRFQLIFLKFAVVRAGFIWTKFVTVGKAFHPSPSKCFCPQYT